MGRRRWKWVRIDVFCCWAVGMWACAFPSTAAEGPPERPNVLWLTCEDISPNLGCYGDPFATSPTIDRLAQQGVRYTHALGIWPVVDKIFLC